MNKGITKGLLLALISSFLYAFNIIIDKKYINMINAESILFTMYLGGSIGLILIHLFTKKNIKSTKNKITKKEVPLVITIVICELLASLFIIEAVKLINASLVSLLSMFEIIMTAICSYFIFKNPLKKNEIIAIVLMFIGCFILNFQSGIFSNINISSLLVIASCLCWGIENNVTAMISSKEPAFFTSIKCFFVALFYLIIALISNNLNLSFPILFFYGFFTYGISILSYAISTKYLGVNKATLVFSFSPIFGVLLALIIYGDPINIEFVISTILMISAILLINKDFNKEEVKK